VYAWNAGVHPSRRRIYLNDNNIEELPLGIFNSSLESLE